MKSVKKFFQKDQNTTENLLMVLLVLFIIFDISVPDMIAPYIASVPGMIVVLLSVGYLFKSTNAVMGILALIAGYELIRRSGGSLSPIPTLPNLQQSELKKTQYLNTVNSFPTTLEENTVNNMVPLVSHADPLGINYHPILDPVNGASPV